MSIRLSVQRSGALVEREDGEEEEAVHAFFFTLANARPEVVVFMAAINYNRL